MILPFEKHINELDERINELKKIEKKDNTYFPEIAKLEEDKLKLLSEVYNKLNRWETTQIARHPNRPTFLDYINYIFVDFIQLHGDRNFSDDKAIVCGLCFLDKDKYIVIGHQKGRNTKENITRNFGMPKPEGYRKALRIMKLAEKFNIPIVVFIDTPGAYPGIDAEERGQSEAIARNLFEISNLKIPIVSIVTGEGGSGGALALGIADKILMLTHSIYSVISPEGCASILWKDASKANEAAESLKMTAKDLLNFNIIDEIINEPTGGAHRNPQETANNVKIAIQNNMKNIKKLSKKKLIEKRYNKLIAIGAFDTKKHNKNND